MVRLVSYFAGTWVILQNKASVWRDYHDVALIWEVGSNFAF
jgi:limonene-1,2-epoxide hydrolase